MSVEEDRNVLVSCKVDYTTTSLSKWNIADITLATKLADDVTRDLLEII